MPRTLLASALAALVSTSALAKAPAKPKPTPQPPPSTNGCQPPHDSADQSDGSFAKPIPFKADTGPLRTRKSAQELSPAEQQKVHDAYAKLRALPDTDPRGWAGQASFHCQFCAGSDADQIHGSWWFFPWHRAYLYFHEKILGSLIGDPSFALPYWNWEKDRHVPDVYAAASCVDSARKPAPAGNAPDSGMPDSIVGPAVIKAALGPTAASRFLGTATQSGVPEGAPHGPVHIWVAGGDKPDMGLLQTAAKDPIFYSHHANIDRLWWRWVHAGHANASDGAFLAKTWKFVGADGKWYAISVKDVIDAEKSLKVTYQPPAGEQTPRALLASVKAPPQSKSAPGQVVVSEGASLSGPPASYKVKLPPPPKTMRLGGTPPVNVLHIDAVAVPSDRSAMVRVFLNKPDASASTPVSDDHFAGYVVSVAKAQSGHGHSHKPLNVALELSHELQEIVTRSGELQVTMVPVDVQGHAPEGMQLKHGKVWLGVGE
jgi:polyphenol oxidase